MRTGHSPSVVTVLGIAGLLLAVQAMAGKPHPTRYPEVDPGTARPVLVVARVSPGRELPEFEACTKPDVICLHSPLWFRARVSRSVYGTAPDRELEVATTSHYGMIDYQRSKAPRLILLLVDGDKVVMPTYANADLYPRDDGELFLVPHAPALPAWLPCSVSTLMQEIDPRRFPGLGIRQGDFWWRTVEEDPTRFTVVDGKAYPRQGISMSALRAHLEALAPDAKAFTCEPSPASPAAAP